MKRLFIVSAFISLFMGNVCAQQGQRSEEDRAKMRAEMIQRVAERSAKDFDLKGDAKDLFITTYTAYQNEMFDTNQGNRQRSSEADEKKELSNEEATAKIEELFTRQTEQITTMQKRLEIQKKYCAEFSKMLTPQQVLKVMTPQRNGQRGQRGQRDGQRDGGWQRGGGRGGFDGPGGFVGPGGFGGPGF